MTLARRFLETCNFFSEKIAIIDDGGPVSYYELAQTSKKVTFLLNNSDVSKQHVGILLPSSKEFVASYFGILFAGKIPVPLNPLYSPAQLSYVIKDANLNTVLTLSAFEKILSNQGINPIYLDKLVGVAPAKAGVKPAPTKDIDPYTGNDDELAALFYTSGTTANPKGVMLTHKNIVSNLQGCVPRFHFTEHEIMLGTLPLFHALAFTTTLALPLYFGATIVYTGRFSAPKALDAITKNKVTFVVAVPSMYRVLLRTIAERQKVETQCVESLRLCTTGGEPVAKDLIDSFSKISSFPLIEGYGLTEASPVVSVNSPENNKPCTAGQPLPNLKVRIVDDNGSNLPANKDGEIWVKGPNVMKGYHNMPEETRQTITPDGWLKTGDIGRLDEDDFLKITGRKKELIIISGENVSPYEIEEVLSHHPKVFEVAVVGVKDDVRGEVPKAYVSLHEHENPPETDVETQRIASLLREFCKGKLPPYKIPKYFEFRKELPHGTTGKVLKRAL
ncbi:MAG TPA: class I adenylate-forming enzyme family protein [Candidatus Brocadiia bacterium]|nr:AMP-binding protein [Candidatus Brocadiales bacterium]